MSYALNKLNTVSVLDPRVSMKTAKNFAVMKTGSTINYKSISSDGTNLSQLNWDADPPNPNTIVSRKVMVRARFEVVLTGTTTNTNLLDGYLGNFGAPRFAPLAQICNVASVEINDTKVSTNVKNLISLMSNCNIEDHQYVKTLSTFPSMKDFYADYADFVQYGEEMNPLNSIGNNGYYQPRGGWDIEIVNNQPTTATIRFSTYEPLFLSPFECLDDDSQGFHGVQTMKVSMVCSNEQRVWSNCVGGGNPATITNVAVSLYEKPELDFVYITPALLQDIPRSLVYDYRPMYDYKTTTAVAVNAGAQFDVLSSLITFPAIPRRIYVFARKQVSSLTYNDSDTFASVDRVEIEYDNRQSLFAQCRPEQLYSISQFNGLEMSYTQSRKHTGSVFIVDVGRDLSLVNDDEATGLSVQKQFQVRFTGTNLSASAGVFELFVVACIDGIMTIEDNRSITQTSVVSKNDILTAKNAQEYVEYVKPKNFYGGAFLKTLGKVAKVAVKHAPEAYKIGKQAFKLGTKIGKDYAGEGLVPDYSGGASVGGARIGGAMMPKSKLASRVVRGRGIDYYEDEE